MAGWMAYSLLTAVLFAGAGLAAEHGLRLHGRPTRWVWLGAILSSLAIPTLGYLIPHGSATGSGALWTGLDSLVGTIELGAAVAAATSESPRLLAQAEPWLIGLWLAGSVGLLLYYLRSFQQLKRESQRWRLRTVEGKWLLVAEDTGPAVMGFRRGRIVLPRWSLELSDDLRRIVILHEEEHLRAGDHRMIFVGMAALICLPWNPLIWWQVRRLRSAVEFDCDRRVLRLGANPHTYSVTLLEVSRRSSGRRLPRAAFAESKSLLEKRIRRMVAAVPRYRGRKSLLAGLTAVALLALSCEARPPTESFTIAPLSDLLAAPTETPFTDAPRIKDPMVAVRALQAHYPQALKKAGVGGNAVVWVLIDGDGKVHEARVKESSGNPDLDEAAARAAQEFEFEPARYEGEIVPGWFTVTVSF